MDEFNCNFNAPMYVDFENLETDGNADEFFDTHLEEEHVTQGIFGQEEKEGQNLPLPQRPTTSTANDAARKSPLKASGSSRSIRKSPLKSWNRQAGTPNNTSIDHLRANSSSVSSLKTINKSGTGKKHLTKDQAAQMVQRLVPSQSSLANKTKFVSNTEEIGKYFGTPDRFRRAKFRSSSADQHLIRRRSPSPSVKRTALAMTNPESPMLLTRGRSRPNQKVEEPQKKQTAQERLASLRKQMDKAPIGIKPTVTSKIREEKAKNAGNVPMKATLKTVLHNGIPIILNGIKNKAMAKPETKKPLPPVPADSVHIKLYEKDKVIRAKLEKEREMEMERERQLAQGVKARIPVVLKQKPFLPTGSDREPVRPIDSHLRTELRSEERRQYEQRRKEKEAEMEAARQEHLERQERQEMLELAKQRNATVQKAQPIRHFAPINIEPSNVPLTEAKTPNFRLKKVRHKSSS